jgi:hypothetical protein
MYPYGVDLSSIAAKSIDGMFFKMTTLANYLANKNFLLGGIVSK